MSVVTVSGPEARMLARIAEVWPNAPLRLRRQLQPKGGAGLRVQAGQNHYRIFHPDGRWAPDGSPAPVEVRTGAGQVPTWAR